MKVVVMGAGIIGVSTAWYLLEQGHDVTVIDRQKDAALETSFANGAQISVSFCEPWANAGAPFKVAKWLLRSDAPLVQLKLFRSHNFSADNAILATVQFGLTGLTVFGAIWVGRDK